MLINTEKKRFAFLLPDLYEKVCLQCIRELLTKLIQNDL